MMERPLSLAALVLASSALAASLMIAACTPQPSSGVAGFAGDPARGLAIASTRCAACHGDGSTAAAAGVPKLGEQFPEYLRKQLDAFAAPASAPNHRVSAVMEPIARALSPQDRDDVAAWYAELWRAPATARAGAAVARGRALFLHGSPADDLPACAACHRPAGTGIRPDFPNLAAQDPTYLERELTDWEALRGHRGKLMSIIAPRIPPRDRAALADYLATLPSRPVPPPQD